MLKLFSRKTCSIPNLRMTAALFAAVIILYLPADRASAAGSDKIIVYPSPVNINTQTVKIGPAPGVAYYTGLNLKIKLEIYTVSGDLVYSRSLTNNNFSPILWRGFDNNGKKISQGLYIARVVIENTDTGDVKIKKIRFLVKK